MAIGGRGRAHRSRSLARGARLLRRHQLPQDIAQALEARPQAAPDDPLLYRATAFARVAAILVFGPPNSREPAVLAGTIGELAAFTSLTEFDAGELVRRCVLAAVGIERTLRAARDH